MMWPRYVADKGGQVWTCVGGVNRGKQSCVRASPYDVAGPGGRYGTVRGSGYGEVEGV